jgi:hypothetical protein
VLRAQLLARGYSDDEIRRICRARRLVAVRRGAYVEPGDERLLRLEDRHGLAVSAAVAQLGAGVVVSHASAAVVHGISVWNVPLDRVHVSRAGTSGCRRSTQLHLHVAPMEPDEVVVVRGIAVTSAAATVAALARTLPFEEAVVIADNALHAGWSTRPRCVPRWTGIRAGTVRRRPAACSISRPVSPRARASRAVGSRCCAPGCRCRCCRPRGSPRRAGGSAGLVKYGRLLLPGQTAGDVVVAGKVREDALRETARGMARWTWAEIHPFDAVDRRLRRLLDLA